MTTREGGEMDGTRRAVVLAKYVMAITGIVLLPGLVVGPVLLARGQQTSNATPARQLKPIPHLRLREW